MTKTIEVLIVDDERYSREELKHLLGEHQQIKIIGEADSGEAAVMRTIQLQPDVVFLDIDMPKMNGIQAAKSMKELKKVPLFVFATAYPDFAADAFRIEAVDYLLKPFEEDQLKDTIKRLEKVMSLGSESEERVASPSSPHKLAIEGEDAITYLNPNDILYIYREEKWTQVVGKEREYQLRIPLKDLEARLKPFSFFRIHKSYLVNLDYVSRLIPWFNGAYHLEIKGRKETLTVSRNYIKGLRSKLEL
ncbi:LytTR family two component transcriptional regulator [Scopulibacillus darangshiensis]|uniref:LytTR family two component transcriptional regulator n=1 Tax=Scopulibacillus darangshiensis TaxID=442528 RepID=A0A4R2NTQ8_9BACL|nr:LytTR family DNA-binding domain-containing protein [Scopulibacillus darangshiensis]TCP24941.1 LytTR family two component transcriptional regulator [Scopulibacillus darangshiensis]